MELSEATQERHRLRMEVIASPPLVERSVSGESNRDRLERCARNHRAWATVYREKGLDNLAARCDRLSVECEAEALVIR